MAWRSKMNPSALYCTRLHVRLLNRTLRNSTGKLKKNNDEIWQGFLKKIPAPYSALLHCRVMHYTPLHSTMKNERTMIAWRSRWNRTALNRNLLHITAQNGTLQNYTGKLKKNNDCWQFWM